MMSKIKDYIDKAVEAFSQKRKAVIVLLVILAVFLIAAIVRADSVVLDSGQVIDVPEGGTTCTYDKVYCPRGWEPDGTFPFVPWAEAFAKLFEEREGEPLNHPVCDDGLVLGQQVFPCYRLVSK